MNQIIFTAIELILLIIAFLIGKFVNPKLMASQTLKDISAWVYKFVVSARNQFPDSAGADKREYVTNLIIQLCKQYNIKLTDEQIRALIEEAYSSMKAGEKESEQ